MALDFPDLKHFKFYRSLFLHQKFYMVLEIKGDNKWRPTLSNINIFITKIPNFNTRNSPAPVKIKNNT